MPGATSWAASTPPAVGVGRGSASADAAVVHRVIESTTTPSTESTPPKPSGPNGAQDESPGRKARVIRSPSPKPQRGDTSREFQRVLIADGFCRPVGA
jgi:hypothetical protein